MLLNLLITAVLFVYPASAPELPKGPLMTPRVESDSGDPEFVRIPFMTTSEQRHAHAEALLDEYFKAYPWRRSLFGHGYRPNSFIGKSISFASRLDAEDIADEYYRARSRSMNAVLSKEVQ